MHGAVVAPQYVEESCGGRGGGLFKIGRPRSSGWKKFGHLWTRGVGGLEIYTIFMDVICVSSLMAIKSTAISSVRYSAEILKWTKDELKVMDRKT